jgi:hypothetical protein
VKAGGKQFPTAFTPVATGLAPHFLHKKVSGIIHNALIDVMELK